MGLKEWRQRRTMRDPVRGEFRPTGSYAPHPNGSRAFHEMMTGVVVGPGVAPTPGEAMQDTDGKWVGHLTLPALIDRANPATFQILWDEVVQLDDRAIAREQAAAAAQQMQLGTLPGPHVPTADTTEQAPFVAQGSFVVQGEGDAAWAQGLVADLAERGMLPGIDARTLDGVSIEAPRVTVEVDGPTENGTPGTAVLREVADIPVPRESLPYPDGSLCTLTLEVNSPNGAYTVLSRLGFRNPRTRAAIAVPGKVLPVRIDPTDPQRVAVDVVEFYTQNPELAL